MPDYNQRITTSTNAPLQNRFSRAGRTVSSNGNTPSATQVQGRAQGVNFTQGQYVRGEVIDLRGHEIKIQLPDSHVLTGNIDDAVQLAIGEQATFRVTEASGTLVSLKLMTDPRAASTELTIDKALDAAGLPRSERNISVVRALLEEGLSVDKNTIQLMLRQSANLRGVSFHTLAILHKQGLPMNEVNARALDSYLNYEHRIMQLAERAAGEFTDTLTSLIEGGNLSEAETLNNELLNMLFAGDLASSSGTADALPADRNTLSTFLGLKDVLSANAASLSETPIADLPLSESGLLSQEEVLTLADTLEQAGLSREAIAAIANGSATLREAAMQILSLAEELMAQPTQPSLAEDAANATAEIAGNTENELSTEGAVSNAALDSSPASAENAAENTASPGEAATAKDSATQTNAAADKPAADKAGADTVSGRASSPVTSLFRSLLQSAGSLFGSNSAAKSTSATPEAPATPLSVTLPEAAATLPPTLQTAEIFTLLNQFASLGLDRSELGAIMPKSKRLALSELLKDKLPGSAREKLENGEISVEKLLSLLLEAEDEESGSGSSSYLSSDSYQEILKQMLKDRFSLKPETLTKKDGIADFYRQLDKDLAFIEKLPSRSVDAPAFQDTAAGIRENIDFMKALGQVFPYVQLPLKLSGKNAHAELYVYTNRRAAPNASDAARVLLHLDMDNLGPLDVHLTLADKLVTARFYLPDAISASLTTENMSEFASMLKNKGYTLDARVEKRERPANPVRDLLCPETENTSMKRYSFDIRA